MPATTGYSAAFETNNSALAYNVESVWGVPQGQFQYIRYQSTTLAGQRTTQRPSEITATREAAQSVTTQVAAQGTVNYAFSATTFDELVFANVLQADWQTPQTINGVAGDIALTASSGAVTLSSTTPNKFANITSGQWIRLLGFTNAANNGFWFVSTGAGNSPDFLNLMGPNSATAVTETPSGASAKVRASTIRNDKICKTYFVEKALDATNILQYPGSYATRMTLNGGLGAFTTGTVDLVAKSEQIATTTSSSGPILAAPTGRVLSPIADFVGVFFNGVALSSGVENFTITVENTGAAGEFAMGSASAIGILSGTHTASGSLRAYVKDFSMYNNVVNETSGQLAIIVKDSTQYAYAFTFLDARLNGSIAIGGPGQAVMADYTIEAGPTAQRTFVIDRMAAS